ncbi:hypothetical protein [Pedobacter sp. Hv1]|nr:hypothetical protein [Pedobacter sp. Hv1]
MAEPLAPPLQLTLFTVPAVVASADGWVRVKLCVVKQPLASVTVTV